MSDLPERDPVSLSFSPFHFFFFSIRCSTISWRLFSFLFLSSLFNGFFLLHASYPSPSLFVSCGTGHFVSFSVLSGISRALSRLSAPLKIWFSSFININVSVCKGESFVYHFGDELFLLAPVKWRVPSQ